MQEWEKENREKVCPFVGDLTTALKKRAGQERPYVFDENIPVSDAGFPGWDGVWITLSSTTQKTLLTVHYWANP